jgi:sulfonate transport system substrate-binding protein
MEITTMFKISRRVVAAIIAVSALLPGGAYAADALKEIRIDWATYNPVSMVLKQKGLLEKEFAKDGIGIVWVQSAGSNKALEFLNAGSIDFGSTAGSAALVARMNGNPIKSIYVFSRPEWTALVTAGDSRIATVADLKGKRVAVTRGTDPHIFLVRALLDAGLSEKDITPVLLQHADGKTALIRGDVDAWAGLADDGAGRSRGRRKAVLPQARRQHLGHPQCARAVFEGLSGRGSPGARDVRGGAEILGGQ